jgi:hypothetical protein
MITNGERSLEKPIRQKLCSLSRDDRTLIAQVICWVQCTTVTPRPPTCWVRAAGPAPGRRDTSCLTSGPPPGRLARMREITFTELINCPPDKEVQAMLKPNPKCRLYWCLIEFIYWRCSQSCWYFRPLLWKVAPLNFSLVHLPTFPPSLCE